MAEPGIFIEGITVNFGNVSANRGYIVAQELLRVVNAEIPLRFNDKRASEVKRGSFYGAFYQQPAELMMSELKAAWVSA